MNFINQVWLKSLQFCILKPLWRILKDLKKKKLAKLIEFRTIRIFKLFRISISKINKNWLIFYLKFKAKEIFLHKTHCGNYITNRKTNQSIYAYRNSCRKNKKGDFSKAIYSSFASQIINFQNRQSNFTQLWFLKKKDKNIILSWFLSNKIK